MPTPRVLRPFLIAAALTGLAASPGRLAAQVLQTDVISGYRYADTSAFGALFLFNASVEEQLNTVVNLGGSADLRANTGGDGVIFSGKVKWSRAGDVTVTNSGYSHLRYMMGRRDRVGPEFFTQYQWDGPRGMKSRFLAGGNVRWAAWGDTVSSLDLAAGLMYEYERWGYAGVPADKRPPDDPVVSVRHPRVNLYLRYRRQLPGGVTFLLMNYVQSRTNEQIDEPRIATAVHVSVDLSRHLGLTVDYDSIYDFAPVVPVRNFYVNVSTGIAVRF